MVPPEAEEEEASAELDKGERMFSTILPTTSETENVPPEKSKETFEKRINTDTVRRNLKSNMVL